MDLWNKLDRRQRDGEQARGRCWTDEELSGCSVPIVDVPLVTIGGGIGSFAVVDTLRICGVPASAIRVISDLDVPYETFRRLARASQISDSDRLRSDSSSTIDNIWGFPGYALREAWASRSPGRVLEPLARVFTEPLMCDFYTPRAGDVYRSIDREAARIGWRAMLVKGHASAVRRRRGGGYFVLVQTSEDTSDFLAYRCRFVHIAVGYSGPRLLPDVLSCKQADGGGQIFNAYEQHDRLYDRLLKTPGSVLVRGAGITASRIVQRLLDDREHRGAGTVLWHLSRQDLSQDREPLWFRRPSDGVWSYQSFNFTKAAWGGQHRAHLESLQPQDRAAFVRAIGGTSTAPRRQWRAQLRRCMRVGAYRPLLGEVASMSTLADGSLSIYITLRDGSSTKLRCDFVIDATGMDGDIRSNGLIVDLLENCGAELNAMARLAVSNDFEVEGTTCGSSRIYASGAMTLGGAYAPVDSFLGLQFAALRIADNLLHLGIGCRLTTFRSLCQWWRWLRNQSP